MRNKIWYLISILFCSMFLISCSSLLKNNEGIFGKSQKTIGKLTEQYHNINNQIAQTDSDKLTHIGSWSRGVERSLDAATNKEPAITTAQQINQRVEELANKPDTDELKQVYKIVDTLLTNQVAGQALLEKKDKEIIRLENNIAGLNQQKQDIMKEYAAVSEANAAKADQYKATLGQMDKWFGLGAVVYGLKKLIISAAWGIGIFSVVFLILRLLSATNPIAGAIFGLFEQVVSWGVKVIQYLFPKAVNLAGFVAEKTYETTRSALVKTVDAIETSKLKGVDVSPITNEAAASMDTDHKNIISEIKTELNYK